MKCFPAFLLLTGFALTSHSFGAQSYVGNGNTGFGGVVSSLNLSDDGTTITGELVRGPSGLNDTFFIYIDSVAGGFSDNSGFEDDGGGGDALRRAISGYGDGQTSLVTFGLDADYAIALNQGFAGIWQLNNGDANAHTFVSSADLSPTGTTTAASYEFTFDLAEIGISPGDSFNFIAGYANSFDGSGGVFRSNEGIGDGLPNDVSGNPGKNPATYTGFRTYSTIPEPTGLALLGLAGLGLLRRRRN